jgi:TonB family protein
MQVFASGEGRRIMTLYEAPTHDSLTLQEVLRRFGPAPVEVALEIGRQVCLALEDLHREQSIHGAVSPANLLLTRGSDGRPVVKLIDLRLAESAPQYASPEQLGTDLVDERSDVYSLGLVLGELLGGPGGQVPEDLRAVVQRATAQDPEQRFAGAEPLCSALEAIQARYPLAGDELAPLFDREAAPEGSPLDEITWGPRSTPAGEGLAWEGPEESAEEEEEIAAAPLPVRAPWRKTSMLPAALPIGVMLVLAFFMFLKGRPWWNPQVKEPPMPPIAAPPTAAAPAPVIRSERHPEGESRAGRIWEGERSARPDPSARPSLQDDKPPRPKLAPKRTPPPRSAPEPSRLAKRETEKKPAPIRTPAPKKREKEPPVRIAEVTRPIPQTPRPKAPRPSVRPAPVVPVSRGPMHRGDLIHPGPNVSVPVPLDMPRFVYPAAARGKAGDVDVRLDLLVDEHGKVIDAVVREGAPADLGFDKVALAAARKVPFQPATRNNVAGKMWTEMIFSFADPSRSAR